MKESLPSEVVMKCLGVTVVPIFILPFPIFMARVVSTADSVVRRYRNVSPLEF